MTTATTILLTYGVTLAASIFALALDAFGRRTAALAIVVAGLAVSASAGLRPGVLHTRAGRLSALSASVGPPRWSMGSSRSWAGGGLWAASIRCASGPAGAASPRSSAFAVAAGGGVAAALDLTTLLLLLETLALVGYALVAVARTARSAEASMKYFVQGAVATGLFLFGHGRTRRPVRSVRRVRRSCEGLRLRQDRCSRRWLVRD